MLYKLCTYVYIYVYCKYAVYWPCILVIYCMPPIPTYMCIQYIYCMPIHIYIYAQEVHVIKTVWNSQDNNVRLRLYITQDEACHEQGDANYPKHDGSSQRDCFRSHCTITQPPPLSVNKIGLLHVIVTALKGICQPVSYVHTLCH